MTTASTSLTINSKKKMTTRNRMRPEPPIYRHDSVPIERPVWRADAESDPMSCMPAKNTVPDGTHKNAGSQPQITATAGPTIGAAPATEVKWWPHKTHLFVGT